MHGGDVLLPVRPWGTMVPDAPGRQVTGRRYLERAPRLIGEALAGHYQAVGKRCPPVRRYARQGQTARTYVVPADGEYDFLHCLKARNLRDVYAQFHSLSTVWIPLVQLQWVSEPDLQPVLCHVENQPAHGQREAKPVVQQQLSLCDLLSGVRDVTAIYRSEGRRTGADTSPYYSQRILSAQLQVERPKALADPFAHRRASLRSVLLGFRGRGS